MIDMKSILSKAEKYIGSRSGKQRITKIVDECLSGRNHLTSGLSVRSPEDAGVKMAEVLVKDINSSGLSPNIQNLFSEAVDISIPEKIANGIYTVRIYFNQDMSRPSLQEDKYGGIDDLVALMNNGVDHTMNQIVGLWHGEVTRSKTDIPGGHFLEQAVEDFKSNYAYNYNVTDIKINGID